MRFIFAKNPSLNYSFPLGVHIDFLWKNLGGVYMTPGRLSPRSEFTPVPSQSSTFVYMIPPQNVICWRESPRREFTRLLYRGDFRPGASSLRFPLKALHLFTWYHHKMSYAGVSHPGVSSPGCCTGARISLWYEISQRYHVNAKRPHVSVGNRSAGGLERVAHA